MPHFMDGLQLPQDWSHFEEAVYFLWLSSWKFLLLFIYLGRMKGWVDLGAIQWFWNMGPLTSALTLLLGDIFLVKSGIPVSHVHCQTSYLFLLVKARKVVGSCGQTWYRKNPCTLLNFVQFCLHGCVCC